MSNGKYGYVCFYNGKRIELYADSSFQAQKLAVEQFKVKPKFAYKISVNLCERPDGSEVIHSAC